MLFQFIVVISVVALVSGEFGSISLLGRTGDGKSSFANLIALFYNYLGEKPFEEGHSIHSHTIDPKTITVGDFQITDNPGLMDTGGVTQDEANIVKIVVHAKEVGKQKGFILVVNSQADRFDAGMQSAVKLLVDSFGPQLLTHMGILFTKEMRKDVASLQIKATELKEAISALTGYPISHMPFWLVDSFPEELNDVGSPRSYIDSIHERNKQTMIAIKAWSTQLSAIDLSVVEAKLYGATLEAQEAADLIEKLKVERDEQYGRATEADAKYKVDQTEATRIRAENERLKAQQLEKNIKDAQNSWGFWTAVVQTSKTLPLDLFTHV